MITGKVAGHMYNIFSEDLDGKTLAQFYDAMSQPFVDYGVLMPDAHLGYGLPIGGVIATKGVVVPAWIGFDISCGLIAVETKYTVDDINNNIDSIFDGIYNTVPVGVNSHKKRQDSRGVDYFVCNFSPKIYEIYKQKAEYQLGTLGGGNHFIEIGYDNSEKVWIVVHTGSRNFGYKLAEHYMKLASNSNKAKEGHYALSLDTKEGFYYNIDVSLCQYYASENRVQIVRQVMKTMEKIIGKTHRKDNVSNVYTRGLQVIDKRHNFLEKVDGLIIHRKGAIDASLGVLGLVSGSMKEGTFIVKGKGNSISLNSCSHGAGRILSRKQAKSNLRLDEFRNQMIGIKAKIKESTLDESPMAYKDIYNVMLDQIDLVEIINHIKPLINIKG